MGVVDVDIAEVRHSEQRRYVGIVHEEMVACILAVACIASLNGCGSKFNGQDTVVEVGDEKVTADVANFFARYQQAQFETTYSSYLGDNFWGKEVTGQQLTAFRLHLFRPQPQGLVQPFHG